MLSSVKFRDICRKSKLSIDALSAGLVRGGLNKKEARSAIKNWQRGLFKPIPRREDIEHLASALSVEVNDIADWCSCCRYAPFSARKARLVTGLVSGRKVQDALDVLKFTNKRAASVVKKALKSAIADADEQEADVESLYVSEARVDDAGVRIGTKRWRAKDRGRAHSIRKKACHIHVKVTKE